MNKHRKKYIQSNMALYSSNNYNDIFHSFGRYRYQNILRYIHKLQNLSFCNSMIEDGTIDIDLNSDRYKFNKCNDMADIDLIRNHKIP